MESNLDTGPIPTDGHTTPVDTASLLNAWLWQPNLIVFISSGCIMILELVAGRIIAPYVGVSLYTWTSVIGLIIGIVPGAGASIAAFVAYQQSRFVSKTPELYGTGHAVTPLFADSGAISPSAWPARRLRAAPA